MTGTTKKTDCHSKQQMKSRQSISPQKKSDMLSQSGRSMVEVLGVLAIVGLISSGGVVGYLRTMNKHRANELKNAVSVRAIACATEISRRREPSLAEFGPYGNYTITAHKSLENTHQFQLVITPAPPSGVCEYFKIMMENTVRFFGGNCDGTDENITLTYNNDLTKTAYATDYGEAEECTAGDKRWCAPEGKCKELNQGCECLGDAPQCYSCDTETGYYEVDPNLENTACKLDPSSSTNDGACRSGSCVDPCAGLELNPCQVYHAENGECVPYDDVAAGTSCGANQRCDGSGHCLCVAGSYLDGTVCRLCAAGTYSGIGADVCTPCSAGTYSGSGSSSCTPCSAGRYSAEGSNSCTMCPAGTYASGQGNSECTPCPVGSYSGTGASSCTPCASGRSTASTGSTSSSSCTLCPAGTYENNHECIPCPAGQYTPYTGRTSCYSCGSGRFASGTGNTTCTLCPVGTYASGQGSAECTPCPEGQYASATGSGSCTPCPQNTYAEGTGNANCTNCPSGYTTSGTGATSSSECQACPAGTYGNNCTPCPNYYYAEGTGNAVCTPCPAGTSHWGTGATSSSECTPCSAGLYSNAGSYCQHCSPGYYAPTAGSARCTPCPAGSYSRLYGQSYCEGCRVGTYASGQGSAECTPCPAGTYSTQGNATSSSVCQPCPSGQTSAAGSSSCKPCFYINGECTPCDYDWEGWDGSYCYDLNPCFTADTPITLANGTCKRADEITYDDELLVWNFDKKCFDKARPLWLKVAEIAPQYNYLKFSDGSVLKTIDQHRIFNREAGKFTYPMTDETPIGTTTLNAKGEWVTLVEKRVVKESVTHYNIITDYHINCFAGNVLTSCRFNNMYPIQDLQFVKDNRTLVDYSEYCAVPRKWYEGLRLAEQPREVNRGNDVPHAKSIVEHIQHVYIDRAQPIDDKS